MLKRLRLKFMVMASLMLAFIGFGSLNEARGQDTVVCTDLPFNPGIVTLHVTGVGGKNGSTFTDGLLGTIESFQGSNIGGLTWLTRDLFFSRTFDEVEAILTMDATTVTGSQLVSWWSRKNGRESVLQVTNTSQFNFCSRDNTFQCSGNKDCAGTCSVTTAQSCNSNGECPKGETCQGTEGVCTSAAVNVHIRILGEDCNEIRDFCDTLTPNDTNVYDFASIANISGALAGHEGIVLVTPVDSCDAKDAIRFDWLQGDIKIKSNGIDEYGTNVYARAGENLRGTCSSAPNITCIQDSDCKPTATNGTCNIDGSGCPIEKTGTGNGFSILTGEPGCRFANVVPNTLAGSFATLSSSFATPPPGGGGAGSDLVLISFIDNYGPPYSVLPGSPVYGPEIFDNIETETSCPQFGSCFVRLGLDGSFPISEDFAGATPTPIPTATPIACTSDAQCPSGFTCLLPTPGPGTPAPGTPAPGVCVRITTPSPTPTRTGGGGGGGGGGCSIGGPVEIGTAMANVLVPLVPAFAIGFRVLRRRSRKNQK